MIYGNVGGMFTSNIVAIIEHIGRSISETIQKSVNKARQAAIAAKVEKMSVLF
ncbi:hypothetical protein [Candidatus Protochlamydia amoebophila]|uniref:Uncharacterized protein n=1 Tax=Candidatus Protochlamydia amoebophila TaxID=362787 RepID=A0A0C1H9N0_9BACT|nr:hypothetical protein [Candidatus Protochlamydia amoebophila]KIC74049.1 hypothetical protein DB44_AR00320 [Candidatus Protochlamydia amoebophila]